MPANTAPIFPATINSKGILLASSTAQTVTLVTGGSNGSVITGINLYQDSNVAVALTFGIKISGTSYKLCKFSTPATTDYAENVLRSTRIPAIDDYNPILILGSGHILEVTVPSVAVNVHLNVLVGDF